MKRGFTLVEMTVVLLIIGIVTHLALRQLGNACEGKRVNAANRQLEEIRASVFAYDREGVPSGFLADMGRTVAVTNGTLSELWRMPGGAKPYAVRPAVAANFVRMSSETLKELTNAHVYVATGWRGPYLRLPVGKTRLMDPWGNPMENPDAAGYDRIAVTNARAMAVSHFGPTALSRDVHRRQISLRPDGGATSRLIVKAVSTSDAAATSVDYRWYGPCDGLITGACRRAVAYGVPCVFDGLTPGMRVVRVTLDATRSADRLVLVRPGDNQMEIRIP